MIKLNTKGFVMIETIVVITILSVGLITLYSSYLIILSKASAKPNYDNVEHIYKTYFVKEYMNANNLDTNMDITTYDDHYNYNINGAKSLGLRGIMDEYNIDKIYIIPLTYLELTEASKLINYDGSTIEYIRTLGEYDDSKKHIIVKFKEEANIEGFYNTNFASLEY